MKIYLAGPLFSRAEQEYNKGLRDRLESQGHTVFLPQEETASLVFNGEDWTENVFNCDRDGINNSDIVVAIMDGTQVDDGTAWECGYAYAKGKFVLGIRTDFRNCGDGGDPVNLMLSESSKFVTSNEQVLFDALKRISEG